MRKYTKVLVKECKKKLILLGEITCLLTSKSPKLGFRQKSFVFRQKTVRVF